MAPWAHVPAEVAVLTAGVGVPIIAALCIGLFSYVFSAYLGGDRRSADVVPIEGKGVVGAHTAAADALGSGVSRGERAAEVPVENAAHQTYRSTAVFRFNQFNHAVYPDNIVSRCYDLIMEEMIRGMLESLINEAFKCGGCMRTSRSIVEDST